MRLTVLLSLMCLMSSAATAAPFDRMEGLLAAAPEYSKPGPNRMVPEQRQGPRIGDRQAASRVKQIYADRKILGIQLIETRGPPVCRVKTLSDEGVVKYVFVDGTSGDVFE